LIGYRDEVLTDTRCTGILNSSFEGYGEYRGDGVSRFTGSIVADRTGNAVPYALFNLEPRGRLFIEQGAPTYEGMIIGEHNRSQDINVNPCKEKNFPTCVPPARTKTLSSPLSNRSHSNLPSVLSVKTNWWK